MIESLAALEEFGLPGRPGLDQVGEAAEVQA
jgi:hypothetical protein